MLQCNTNILDTGCDVSNDSVPSINNIEYY